MSTQNVGVWDPIQVFSKGPSEFRTKGYWVGTNWKFVWCRTLTGLPQNLGWVPSLPTFWVLGWKQSIKFLLDLSVYMNYRTAYMLGCNAVGLSYNITRSCSEMTHAIMTYIVYYHCIDSLAQFMDRSSYTCISFVTLQAKFHASTCRLNWICTSTLIISLLSPPRLMYLMS